MSFDQQFMLSSICADFDSNVIDGDFNIHVKTVVIMCYFVSCVVFHGSLSTCVVSKITNSNFNVRAETDK